MSGDASARRYARLTGPDGQSAILMDAKQEPAAARAAFCAVADHLIRIGLVAPRTLWSDDASGLSVIEDLGHTQFSQWLVTRPGDSDLLYAAAVDVLTRIQSHPPLTGLVALTPTRAAGMITPLFEWYATDTDARTAARIIGTLQDLLSRFAPVAECLALRDFHAENLIWRADRTGTDRVGLLDFQDAVLGPPEYDLVSLLRDARRDVSPALRDAMMARFAALTGRDPDRVAAAAAVIGVQRNLRILGIFGRLARRDGKLRYLDLVPRVLDHIKADLAHPHLAELENLILGILPPTDAVRPDRGAR